MTDDQFSTIAARVNALTDWLIDCACDWREGFQIAKASAEDVPTLLAQLAAQQETITALRAQIVELREIAKGRLEGVELARVANERNNP